MDVRLRGIRELGELAKEVTEKKPQIAKVLSDYVREAAPCVRERSERQKSGDEVGDKKKPMNTPRDVQEVLTAIGNFDRKNPLFTGARFIDLSGTNLQNADLFDVNLEHANLTEANLEGANLWAANLENANLNKANMREANLFEAHLKYGNFCGANFENAKLWEANLEGANLRGANLNGADLRGAKLKGAILQADNLKDAKYNQRTTFPDWLNQEMRGRLGMVCQME